MQKAIVLRETGDPEVLKLEDIPEPKKVGPNQVLIRQTAIAVNYHDIYYRTGMYKAPKFPMIPGMEAVGVVEAVGEGVNIEEGARVAYATVPSGAYCQKRVMHQRYLVGVPEEISDEMAMACLSKGMTAHYLVYRAYHLKKGETILVHAAAGGVGHMLCQWAKSLGARVIGTVGSQAKAMIASNSGCDHVINYSEQDFVAEVKKITKGEGVPVVYDSVGKTTFMKSLQCLRPLGLMVSYGQSSGMVPPINIMSLAAKSLFLTRPTLSVYKQERMEMCLTAVEVFKRVYEGKLTPSIGATYPLAEAAKAHADMQARKTSGSVILKV